MIVMLELLDHFSGEIPPILCRDALVRLGKDFRMTFIVNRRLLSLIVINIIHIFRNA